VPVSKQEFIQAFGANKGQTLTVGTVTVTRRDYPASVEISVSAGGETVILEWSNEAVAFSGRSSESPFPLVALMSVSTRPQLAPFIEKFLGAPKVASVSNPQAPIQLGGFANILVTHDSASLATPVGFAANISIAAAMLLETAAGVQIAERLQRIGVRINVSYSHRRFQFAPRMDSDTAVSTTNAGMLLADPAVSVRYFAIRKAAADAAVVHGWFHGKLAALMGHEMIHAIHAYEDPAAYMKRGTTAAVHEDFEDMEEQFTMTGAIGGSYLDVSECDILHEFGYLARWGHVNAPTVRGGIASEVMSAIYGAGWADRIR
jgi:hypothetical protein